MFDEMTGKSVNRRSFLRGSALFAAALGLAVAPAVAQQAPPQRPEDKEKKEDKKPPKDPFDTGDQPGDSKKLIDKEGREYRICPQCGYNMYKEGRMWVCENCGYSYVE